ncbi:MAG: zinc ribbon domain-containing protein [Aphanocapsa sp. GSE-SYN-MK-11-07L]|jgi:hypothetical protein|nr:zinc ribbon domain-containing protein [Aphanocapsa sp. GSE-SYN-MK-11-07L]
MTTCPRCQQAVDAQAITCLYCGCVLKAHGHPGIPLHRSDSGQYLCSTCVYEADDTCNFPQRPYATECTLYRDQAKPAPTFNRRLTQPNWQRSWIWLILVGIIVLAIVLALLPR